MKNWVNAEVVEMSISETQYGGKKIAEFDYIYQDSDGNWEGSFQAS